MNPKVIVFSLCLIVNKCLLYAQVDSLSSKADTTTQVKLNSTLSDSTFLPLNPTPEHKPGKAARLSMICPGLGQIYNRRYWKLPIVYGLMGTLGTFAVINHQGYVRYQTAYRYRTDKDDATVDEFVDQLNDEAIRIYRNSYRRTRDLMFIFMGLSYTLNVIDAYVDAHLLNFDVSDNLSMKLQPALIPQTFALPAAGFSLTVSLKK